MTDDGLNEGKEPTEKAAPKRKSLAAKNAEDIANLQAEFEHLKQESRDEADAYGFIHNEFHETKKALQAIEKDFKAYNEKMDFVFAICRDYEKRFHMEDRHHCKAPECQASMKFPYTRCPRCGLAQ